MRHSREAGGLGRRETKGCWRKTRSWEENTKQLNRTTVSLDLCGAERINTRNRPGDWHHKLVAALFGASKLCTMGILRALTVLAFKHEICNLLVLKLYFSLSDMTSVRHVAFLPFICSPPAAFTDKTARTTGNVQSDLGAAWLRIQAQKPSREWQGFLFKDDHRENIFFFDGAIMKL